MNTLIATFVLISLFTAVVVLLERSRRRADRAPHLPPGSDLARDADFQRVLHDLDVAPR